MRITNTIRTMLGVSLLYGASLTMRADDTVTFQVDMNRYTNSAGAQVATLVEVRGDGIGPGTWGSGNTLVNNGANVYTNTFNCVGAAASTHEYKFFYKTVAGDTWEDNMPTAPPDNRVLTLIGGQQTLPLVEFYAPSVSVPIDIVLNNVTFNVDMSSMTNSAGAPAYTAVNASGAFNSWGQTALVNNGANVYTNTFVVGANGNYKYTCVLNGGTSYEDGADHPIVLTGSPQTLPLLAFNNSGRVPIDFVTNNVTFQVDMQVQGVAFDNAGGYVSVAGSFGNWSDSWGNSRQLFQDHDYVYTNTFAVTYQKAYPNWAPAAQFVAAYKFRANSGWEEPAFNPLFGNTDRRFSGLLAGPADTLPLVLYSDASLCDVLHQDTTVTFRLHLTNGTVATSGLVYDKDTMGVYMNGETLLGFWESWGNTSALPLLTNNPVGSDLYEYTQVIPAGRPISQKVKYSINGPDNEAPQFADHIQWIRTTNTTYTMATVEFGTNYSSTRVQSQYGNLKAGAPSGGNVPITWDGCPCVTLQQRSSLSSGSWTDLPATESAGSASVPNTGSQFFRLQKRFTP